MHGRVSEFLSRFMNGCVIEQVKVYAL